MSCLIRDVLIVPPPPEAPFEGWVEVVGDKIAAVGRGQRRDAHVGTVIEGGGGALIPGLVNTHAHSHSSLTRGSAEGMALERWLEVIEREQAALSDEQAYVGALATYAEAMLSGTTSMVDMCIRPEPALQAARDIGIRATIVPYVADTIPFAPSLAAERPHAGERRQRGPRAGLGRAARPRKLQRRSRARGCGAGACARHRAVHLHCSETRLSVERTQARIGRTPMAQLDHLGALDARTLLAHCVWAQRGGSRAARRGAGARGALPARQSQARLRDRADPRHAPARHQRRARRPTAPRPTTASTCST